MGTSKGYIPPTRIQWTNAKRAVTKMLNDRDASSTAKATSRFATAMSILILAEIISSNIVTRINAS